MKTDKILLPADASHVRAPWFWIGTWSMGGEGFGAHDERESLKVLEAAVAEGISHFDTAGFYAHGKSELLLQKIINKNRKRFFLASKGGLAWKGRHVEHQGAPEQLRRQLHESFDRLKTDYLDLYMLHWPDPKVPIRDSITALKELKEEGLIRHWGVSNLSDYDVYDELKGEMHVPHQVHFNPLHRMFKILHAGEQHCINCITSPLEQGLLARSHTLTGTSSFGKNDLRRRNPYFSNVKILAWSSRFDEMHTRFKLSKVVSILLWICSQPHVHAVIPGPRRTDQLKELIQFMAMVNEKNLLSSGDEASILSAEKTAACLPPEIWKRLVKGP